ncbi:MAG: glycosyltransferase, partial [Phycisphaerae bacterium]
MLLVDLVEKGALPATQLGHVDLHGGPRRWLQHRRSESVVFVVTGRNVPPGRMRRCLDSLLAQEGDDWGAIVIDDGSEGLTRDYLSMFLARHRDRITLLQPRERRGQLANTVLAVRHVCVDPEAVIITLDLDDALLGRGVARRVLAAHRNGAD